MATGFRQDSFNLEDTLSLDPNYRAQRAVDEADEAVQDLLTMGAGYGNNTHSSLSTGVSENPLSEEEIHDANIRYDKARQGGVNAPSESATFSLNLGAARERAEAQRNIEITPRYGKWEDLTPAEKASEAYDAVGREMESSEMVQDAVNKPLVVGPDNVPGIGSFHTAAESAALQRTAENIANGSEDPADYLMFAKAMHKAKYEAEEHWLKHGAEATLDMATLIADYLVTGGAGSASGAAGATAKSKALTKTMESALKNVGGKKFITRMMSKTGAHLKDVGLDAAKKMPLMGAPRAQQKIAGRNSFSDFEVDDDGNYQFKEQEEGLGRDVLEAVSTAYAELVIERIIPDGVLTKMASGSKNKAIKRLGDFLEGASESRFGRIASSGGFGGMLTELGEERLTELANYAITDEEEELGTTGEIYNAITTGDPESIESAWKNLGVEGTAIASLKGMQYVATLAGGRKGRIPESGAADSPVSPSDIPRAEGQPPEDAEASVPIEAVRVEQQPPMEDIPVEEAIPLPEPTRDVPREEGPRNLIRPDHPMVETPKGRFPKPIVRARPVDSEVEDDEQGSPARDTGNVFPVGHPLNPGTVDTKADVPTSIEAPPVIEDEVKAPPVIGDDVEAPPVIQQEPEIPVAEEVPTPVRPDRAQPSGKRKSEAEAEIERDINNPIERISMKGEDSYRSDVKRLVKKTKRSGRAPTRKEIKDIGYLDGTLYDNKKYDFGKKSERQRFVNDAATEISKPQTIETTPAPAAQETRPPAQVKVVPEFNEPGQELDAALNELAQEEGFEQAGEVKGSRKAAAPYEQSLEEYYADPNKRRKDTEKKINSVIMRDIPPVTDKEQENKERASLITERLDSLGQKLGVQTNKEKTIRGKKNLILDKLAPEKSRADTTAYDKDRKAYTEVERETLPSGVEVEWEKEKPKRMPLPPGYAYDKDGKPVKTEEPKKKRKPKPKPKKKAPPKSETPSAKAGDPIAQTEKQEREKDEVLNEYDEKIAKERSILKDLEDSGASKTKIEYRKKKIKRLVNEKGEAQRDYDDQLERAQRELKDSVEPSAKAETEQETIDDDQLEQAQLELEESIKPPAKAGEEGTALERMQKLDRELFNLQGQRQDSPTRKKVAQLKADKLKLAKELEAELKINQKKDKDFTLKDHSKGDADLKNREDAVPIDINNAGVKVFSPSQEDAWSKMGSGGGFAGWKFHLNVKPENLDAVYNALDELGLYWKGPGIGTDSKGKVIDDTLFLPKKGTAYQHYHKVSPDNNWESIGGKPVTIYGTYKTRFPQGMKHGHHAMSRDVATDIARRIDEKVGDKIEAPAHDVLKSNSPFLGNIWTRFDVTEHRGQEFTSIDAQTEPMAKKRFARYGGKGIQNTQYHFAMRPFTDGKKKYNEGLQVAYDLLTDQFGTYFQGSGVNNKFPNPYKNAKDLETVEDVTRPADEEVDDAIQDQEGKRPVASEEGAKEKELQDGRGLSGSVTELSEKNRATIEAPALEGLPTKIKLEAYPDAKIGPSKAAREAAAVYMERAGMEYNPPRKYVKVDKERAKKIADWYDSVEHNPDDPKVRESYQAMMKETLEQWKVIKETGLKIEWITEEMLDKDGDPYEESPRLATEDINRNNHFYVFPTDLGFGTDAEFDPKDNPLFELTDEIIDGKQARYNDIFRIVHDYFGHVKEGNGFRAFGEENAWRSHLAMYSDKAKPAMTMETRGQNSWVNYGPHGEFNRTASGADTIYADQKINIPPAWIINEGAVDPKPAPKRTPKEKKKVKKAGKARVTLTSINRGVKDLFGKGVSLVKNPDGDGSSFIIKTTRNAEFVLKPDASMVIEAKIMEEGETQEDADDRWFELIDKRLVGKTKEEEIDDVTWEKEINEIEKTEGSEKAHKVILARAKESSAKKKGSPSSSVDIEGTKEAEWLDSAIENEKFVLSELEALGVDTENLIILPDQFDEAFHDRPNIKEFNRLVYGDSKKTSKGGVIDISKLDGDKGWQMVLEALLQHRSVYLSLNKQNFSHKPNTLDLFESRLKKELKKLNKSVDSLTESELQVIRNNVGQELGKRAEPARAYDHMVFDKKNLRLISQDGTFTVEWKYNPSDAMGSRVIGGPAIGNHNNRPIPFNIEMAIKMTPEEFRVTNWDKDTIPPSVMTVLSNKEWDKMTPSQKSKHDSRESYEMKRITSFHENLVRYAIPKETSGAKSTENIAIESSIAQEAEMKARTYRRRTPYKVMKAYPQIFPKEIKEFEQRREEKLGPNSPAPLDNLSLEHIDHLFSPLDVKPLRSVPANFQVTEQAVRAFAGGVSIAKTRGGYVLKTPNGEFNIVHTNDIRHLNGMELKRYEGVYTKKQLEAAAKHQPMAVYVRGKGKRKYGITDLGTIYLNEHPDSIADMGTLAEELFHVADVMGFVNSTDRRKLVKKYSSLDKDFLTQSEEIAHALKTMERKDRTFILGSLRKFTRKLMKLFGVQGNVGRVMLDAMKTGTIWETRDDVRAKRINSMLDSRDLLYSPSTSRGKARKTKVQVAAESTAPGAAASLPARVQYAEQLRREHVEQTRREARAQRMRDGFTASAYDSLERMNEVIQNGFSSVDMQKAKMLHDELFELQQDPKYANSPEFRLLAEKFREAYRMLGTFNARALNARKAVFNTEEEAIQATLMEAVFTPNKVKSKKLAKLLGVEKEFSNEGLLDSALESGDPAVVDRDGNMVGTTGNKGSLTDTGTRSRGTGAGTGRGTGGGAFAGWNIASINKLPPAKKAEAKELLSEMIKEEKEIKEFLKRQGFDISKSGLKAISKNPVRARQLLDALTWKKMHQVDKAFAWMKHIFYNNLLSGITTHVTNITNNALYLKYRQFEQAAGRRLFFSLSDPAAVEKSLLPEDFKAWKAMERKIKRESKNVKKTGKSLNEEWSEAVDFVNRGVGAAWTNAVNTFVTDQSAVDSERLTADELDWYRQEHGIVAPIAETRAGKAFISATGVPTKLLRSGDEFFRSVTLNGMAGVFAASEARLALARGEIGTADVDSYIIKQLNNKNSTAWNRAHLMASEMVHQETDEGVRGLVIKAVGKVQKGVEYIKGTEKKGAVAWNRHLAGNILDMGLRVFALPFRRTPINLLGKGIARSPGLGLILNGGRVVINKSEGRAAFDGIEGEAFAAMLNTILLFAMVAWGDDEEEGIGWKNFGWTGARQGRDYREKLHGYRPGVAGSNEFRVGGHTFNYANVEPFASAMSVMADIGDAYKDDGVGYAILEGLGRSAKDQISDRSFTQGLDNWYKVWKGGDRAGAVFADAIASFLVPNFFRQLTRESKNYVVSRTSDSFARRLQKSAELPEWMNSLFGFDAIPPVVDAWGMVARNEFRIPFDDDPVSQELRKAGNLFIPMLKYTGENETFIGDKPYIAWNKANSEDKKYPRNWAGTPWERKFTHDGVEYKLNEFDYAHLQYFAGGIASKVAKSAISPKMAESPNEFDMARIEEFRRRAYEMVKTAYLGNEMYNVDIEGSAEKVINDMKSSISEAKGGKGKYWIPNEFLSKPDSDEYKEAVRWKNYYQWLERGE